ncbi:MAG: hypothetical protein Kow0037_11110 [Calditrichia bacterium]
MRQLIWTVVFFTLLPTLLLAKFSELGLSIPPEQSKKFVFSNKISAFWYGETGDFNNEGYQGYTILERRYLKDYAIRIGGKLVPRRAALSVQLFPTQLVRDYEQITEVFHFVDSLNALVVEVQPKKKLKIAVEFYPEKEVLKPYFEWNDSRTIYSGTFTEFGYDKPTVIGCFTVGGNRETNAYKAPEARAGEILQGALGLEVEAEEPVYFIIAFAQTQPEMKRMRRLFVNPPAVFLKREKRVARLLENASLQSDALLDKAFAWTAISMNDLVTAQKGTGIWAGLPWFNNYWGRDTFISFTGGLLCTGQFKEAREVLKTFAGFQNTNEGSPYYGRIPNRIMLNETIYNTTDGTPWFVIACNNYLKFTGDSLFQEELFPVIHRAMQGALLKHVDNDGFLTHEDAETWMDAVGSEGPWSPRGNRAVEVQVLWLEQIRIAAGWAKKLGHKDLAAQWAARHAELRKMIFDKFWDDENQRLYDHLNPDGSPDFQIRPNQIFALTIPEKPLFTDSQEQSILKEVINNLVYRWGTSSLAQTEPRFHPYHHYQPYYVPDAAYHNGVVWTWLTGPVLSALFSRNPDMAFELLQEEARQVLEENAIGSLSELLDAWPREGTDFPQISGTVSQAWSLAEFIRNVQQDLLGVRPAGLGDTLNFSPRLPGKMERIAGKFRLRSSIFQTSLQRQGEGLRCEISAAHREAPQTIIVVFEFSPNEKNTLSGEIEWNTASKLQLMVTADEVRDEKTGAKIKIRKTSRKTSEELHFVSPTFSKKLAAFQGPGHPLIQPEEVTQKPGRLTRILYDVYDPENDDRGPNGKYQYPTNPAFKEGIFDIKRVKIWKDKDYYYFLLEYKDLVNPGWHPESGYQLTYTAIALNFGHEAGLRRTRVHMNANYNVPFEYAYNYILFIGNGIQIRNSQDEILAEYRPMDRQHPIGFPDKKAIHFSIPVRLLPDLKLWNAFVMVGGQDDHGAGGLGEFRNVGVSPTEWQGGGADAEPAPNVYDVVGVR